MADSVQLMAHLLTLYTSHGYESASANSEICIAYALALDRQHAHELITSIKRTGFITWPAPVELERIRWGGERVRIAATAAPMAAWGAAVRIAQATLRQPLGQTNLPTTHSDSAFKALLDAGALELFTS